MLGGPTLTVTNTIENAGTLETATRTVDGLAITYPADEADVIELLLPTIAKYRAERRATAKLEADALIEALSTDSIRENYRTQIPHLLGLKSVSEKSFAAGYDAALKDIERFVRQWEKWSGDLSALNFWNRATSQPFKEGERTIFPEISYARDPKTGSTNFTIRPSYINQHVGLELIRPPTGANAVKPFRLDLPLFYPPGISAEELAAHQRKLFDQLPGLLQTQLPTLTVAAAHYLMEAFLQSEIKAQYFTAEASDTPGEAVLIRALARYYLLASMKASGKITRENEAQKLAQLFYSDLPEGDAARAEFLRAFESLDPFSGKSNEAGKNSEYLFVAGSRLATVTLVKLAQRGDDNGRPIFQKLRAMGRIPEGGFHSVASFTAALEAAYPSSFKDAFLAARSEALAAIKSKIAGDTPKAEAAPKAAAKAMPLPDRQTQVFDGVTITHPAVLREAIAKLGPELADLVKKARARIDERFDKTFIPPIPITDGALDIIRRDGFDVTREEADFFSSQAALLANSAQMLIRIFEGDSVQVWFRDDLKALLKEGREVPGFSYDPATDKGNFDYAISGKGVVGTGKPLNAEAFQKAFANQPAPIYPIVLKDRGIAGLNDVESQVAIIRKEDTITFPLLQGAGTITPAQLGIQGGELDRGGLLTPAQTLFTSVHELVEMDLIAHVIASADRRWFCEGVANLLAIRACDQQFGQPGDNTGRKVFESLFDPATLGKRAPDIDLLAWPAVGDKSAQQKNDEGLTQAHYYFATRVLLAATEGRGDGFLKSWITKIRETPWNRANAATIIAAYDQLTGESLREVIKKTVATPSL